MALNSNQFISDEPPKANGDWLKRIWQEPTTFIILVWVVLIAIVGLCFALID